jgi:hypothetical protein
MAKARPRCARQAFSSPTARLKFMPWSAVMKNAVRCGRGRLAVQTIEGLHVLDGFGSRRSHVHRVIGRHVQHTDLGRFLRMSIATCHTSS